MKKKTKLNKSLRKNNINLFSTSICELIHKCILLGHYQHVNFVGMPADSSIGELSVKQQQHDCYEILPDGP